MIATILAAVAAALVTVAIVIRAALAWHRAEIDLAAAQGFIDGYHEATVGQIIEEA